MTVIEVILLMMIMVVEVMKLMMSTTMSMMMMTMVMMMLIIMIMVVMMAMMMMPQQQSCYKQISMIYILKCVAVLFFYPSLGIPWLLSVFNSFFNILESLKNMEFYIKTNNLP